MNDSVNCLNTIRSLYPSMHAVERAIADLILSEPDQVVHMTVAQISRKINVADSSIVRFCQTVGFDGFKQLKINLATNLTKPDDIIFEDINQTDDSITVASKVFASRIETLQNTFNMLDKDGFEQAVNTLLAAKRIEFYGVGTSAVIAEDAFYRFLRIGLPAYAVTDPHIARISAAMLDKNCVAVGISHTGRTKDTINIMEIAKSKGAKTICISSFNKTPLTDLSDTALIISSSQLKFMKEEVSSRIAQIAILDSLYTCIALKKYNSAHKNMETITKLLNESRF